MQLENKIKDKEENKQPSFLFVCFCRMFRSSYSKVTAPQRATGRVCVCVCSCKYILVRTIVNVSPCEVLSVIKDFTVSIQ